ncbi:LysR family transcriptional regulator [Thalassococcus sp. S3]|uniref:LysR family transcriptional regulator n=1 Tax=Thalassococcus sp. S3 TaxID=2017482 RepID=UPI0010241FEF|nr:LysR family transcriptional regulator [Thalassococcus sp. S3]QBF31373.1 LysR family transcriptional regulator [Thalassococcus sp. S3]
MNWQAISFDWNQVRAFLATVEEGSLSAAARALGSTQPTVGRQVAALEEALGVLLFERVGRSLALTPTGRDLFSHVRAMGEMATRISLTASGRSQEVAGKVSITASDGMSTYLLPRILERLRAQVPGIEIDVVAANDLRDLQRREADIAIRHVRPEQPELIARLVREEEGHIYVSPGYIARYGRPETLEDLNRGTYVGVGDRAEMILWLNRMGLSLTPENFPICVDSTVAAWEMARQGLGLGVNIDQIAALAPEMEQVAPPLEPIPVPTWLVTHRELHTSRRIRVVFDFLAEALAG